MVEMCLQTLLAETMRDVLETSFFAEILEENVETSFDPGSMVAASMTFSGAASGSFLLAADQLSAHALAVEFMGDPGEEADDGIAGCGAESGCLSVSDEEVFKELTNILCGSVLSRFRMDRCCHLSQPVLLSEGIPGRHGVTSDGECIYSAVRLESGIVAGWWRLDVAR